MIRRLQHDVRVNLVPQTLLGRLLAGMAGVGVLILGVLFFMVLLVAVGAVGMGFMIYTLHAQRKAQRDAPNTVIEGEYTVESSDQEDDGRVPRTPSRPSAR